MKKIILFLLFLTCIASAQKRYLITPFSEAIPLQKNQPVDEVIKKAISNHNTLTCGNAMFGYPIYSYSANTGFSASHKDALAMWFIVPANGTIDSLFWVNGDVGAKDSTILIRIHESKIGPGKGPGYDLPGSCQNWGYWQNSNDLDMGVGAFPEDATDTTWHSTISFPNVSYPPMGEEIWGLGGFPVPSHENSINSIDLDVLGKPEVQKGDWIWVSMRISGETFHTTDNPTTFVAIDQTNGAPVPSRAWKFYEHPNQATNCNNEFLQTNGWVERGGPTNDSTSAYAWNWWYVMTVTSDLPPVITDQDFLINTISNSPREINATIEDCNTENPASAGVAKSLLYYSTDNRATWDSVNMSNSGGDEWSGEIPGFPNGTNVSYYLSAYDSADNNIQSRITDYRVLGLENNYYKLDTTVAYNWTGIEATGTRLTSWFDRTPFAGNIPQDNGTSGPIDIGWTFPLFGQDLRYAWIGVNGAITLSATATDTIDVFPDIFNCPDNYFGFPSSCNPDNYIAPLAYDFVIEPRLGTGEGHGGVFYQQDGDKFIVQWNKLGRFVDTSDTNVTFQLVLNHADSSITFQYKELGNNVSALGAATGIQLESENKWFALSLYGSPEEFVPREGKALRFTPNNPNDVVEKTSTVPSAYSLRQNYPNPFNPTTNFQFSILDYGFITLKVYDILGKEVATIVNEKKAPGEYNVTWDASAFPSGVYTYKLTALPLDESKSAPFIQSKHMVFLK